MKNCFCIAEYNPFHLGHLKQIEYIKRELAPDNLTVIMSGNFTERGEFAILNKYKRAAQAKKCGADLVIELPTVFAIGNAETFASGAIKIIDSLNQSGTLCFGVESGKKEEYFSLALAMNDESKEFKKAFKESLDNGYSVAKSKFLAVKAMGKDFNEELVSSPNNILGVEYTKAVIKANNDIEIYPILREGDHNDDKLKKGITSASSIRKALYENKIKKVKPCVPKEVYSDLSNAVLPDYNNIIMTSLIIANALDLEKCPDCSEGLENRIKALSYDNKDINVLIEKASTKRYTESRIRRIIISNLLGVSRTLLKDCFESPLYAKVLAVKKEKMDIISNFSKTSSIPLLTRKTDVASLKKTAKDCFEIDSLANEIYNLATNDNTNENYMIII